MEQQSGNVNQTRQANVGEQSTVARQSPPQPNALQKYLKTPKGYVLVLLLILMVIDTALYAPDRRGILNVAVAMATAVVIDLIVALLRGQNKRLLSDGGLVTGAIVGLVLAPSVSVPITMIATAVAIASKHLLKSGRKPWFNPAAVGLLFSSVVLHTGQSWWGDLADLHPLEIVFVIVIGYLITSRINKFPQVLSFLGAYFAILAITGFLHWGHAAFTPGDALRWPLINSALFMAFFMLTDPPTSPGKYKDQVWFGVITGVVGTLIYLLFGGLNYWLIALLVANAWKAWAGRQVVSSTLKEPVQRATG